jgi:hypothetical protein
VQSELKLGKRLRTVVLIERRLAIPLAHENEPIGICQAGGERETVATGLVRRLRLEPRE